MRFSAFTHCDRLWGLFVRWQEGDSLATPLDIRVSEASVEAAAAVLDAGGSLTLVYYNALGLRALLKPEKWAAVGKPLPRFVRWGGGVAESGVRCLVGGGLVWPHGGRVCWWCVFWS